MILSNRYVMRTHSRVYSLRINIFICIHLYMQTEYYKYIRYSRLRFFPVLTIVCALYIYIKSYWTYCTDNVDMFFFFFDRTSLATKFYKEKFNFNEKHSTDLTTYRNYGCMVSGYGWYGVFLFKFNNCTG